MEGSFDTKLHEAVRYGDLEEVKIALHQGYDPNLIGLYQWSAIHEAAHNGHKEILQLLLEKKGDPNKSDFLQQRTAMHYASENGHIECLKMLLAAGGKYDIKDTNGKTSLDVATPTGRKILEKLHVRDLMLMSPEAAKQSIVEEESGISPDTSSPTSSQPLSDSPNYTRRSSSDSLANKGPALGYLHLSVEYHSTKLTMKVRAWQLTDLLLPPPNTSMIHSIYVKSYLVPDKKKETKRKTEEIKVESTESHIHWKKSRTDSIQHIFTPSSFKFSRALEYSNITSDIIKDKHIQIEVCITQKYSHRSFLIGMLNMPLKSAVKRVVKEKMALIPCMNHSIPGNMKVYNAQDLNIMSNASSKVFFSNPNVRVMIPDNLDNESDRAASDPDLQPSSPSIEVDMTFHTQTQSPVHVPKLDFSSMGLDESGYSSEVHISFPGEMESPDSDSMGKSVIDQVRAKVSTIDMATKPKGHVKRVLENVKGKFSPRSSALTKLHKDGVDVHLGTTVVDVEEEDEDELRTVRSETNTAVEDWKYQDIKNSVRRSQESSDSRPSTPTWDYYDMPDEVISFNPVPQQPKWVKGAAPVLLPMATTMETPRMIKDRSDGKESKHGKHQGSKTNIKKSIPGKAVPLVPEIVIVNVDEEEKIAETSLSMPEMSDVESEPLRRQRKVADEEAEFDHVGYNGNRGAGGHSISYKNVDSKAVQDSETKFRKKEKKDKESSKRDTDEEISKRVKDKESNKKAKSKHKTKDMAKGLVEKDTNPVTDNNKKELQYKSHSIKVKKSSFHPVANKKHSKELECKNLQKKVQDTKCDSSVVLEMDHILFNSGDSHIVELDDGLSITEIGESDSSQLFSHMTTPDQSLQASDVESGRMEYHLPVNMSPKHYMIPMNVYTEDDTSCDESLPTDRSYIPTTEL